jgi:hypothetical protein
MTEYPSGLDKVLNMARFDLRVGSKLLEILADRVEKCRRLNDFKLRAKNPIVY